MALGLGLGLHKARNLGANFTTEYQAVLDYATTQGYTLPSPQQQQKQNTFVKNLLPHWGSIAALQVYATDANSGFASIDFKRLTKATLVNSPTFTTNQGFNSDGISSYINPNFIYSTNAIFGLNENFYGVITEISGSTSGAICGANDNSNFSNLYINDFAYNNMAGVGGNFANGAPSTNTYLSSSRQNSAEHVRRCNGADTMLTESSTAKPNQDMFVLCRNNNGSADDFNTRPVKIFVAGAFVNQATIETILNNYINSL